MQMLSPPMVESRREPHCAQTIGDGLPSGRSIVFISASGVTARWLHWFFSFMRLPPKYCKDSAVLRQSRAAPKRCERFRGARFRDNAVAADGHASLLLLWEDRCAPMRHHTRAERCRLQESS